MASSSPRHAAAGWRVGTGYDIHRLEEGLPLIIVASNAMVYIAELVKPGSSSNVARTR